MKKIAVMTWYKYRNYGTVLQCAALSRTINNLGYESCVISYGTAVGKYQYPGDSSLNKLIKKSVLRRLNKGYSSLERERLFDEFIKANIKETNFCNNYSELYQLNSKFDAFICGSDQIWSPTQSFDDKYFLSFVDDSKLKFSYAPSFGVSTIHNNLQKEVICGLLNRFDAISVRENQAVKIVEELIGRTPRVVLDPTLLLDQNEWNNIVGINRRNNGVKDYILCYFLGDYKKYINNVKAISEYYDVPYYIIPTTSKQSKSHNLMPFEVGPNEFVSLITLLAES